MQGIVLKEEFGDVTDGFFSFGKAAGVFGKDTEVVDFAVKRDNRDVVVGAGGRPGAGFVEDERRPGLLDLKRAVDTGGNSGLRLG